MLLKVETKDHGQRTCAVTKNPPAGKHLLYVSEGKLFKARLMGPPSRPVSDSGYEVGAVQDLATLARRDRQAFEAWSEEHGMKLCVNAARRNSIFPMCLYIDKGEIYLADKDGPTNYPCTQMPRMVGTLEDVAGVCKFMRQEGTEDKGCAILLDQAA